MLKEYFDIREKIKQENPSCTADVLDNITSLIFRDQYSIPIDRAIELENDNQWERWLSKHSGDTNIFQIHSTPFEIKSDVGKNRYVEFDLMLSEVDKGGDLIPPEVIGKVAADMQGALIKMYDPSQVVDADVAKQLGQLHGGIGHEHHYISKDIVPALTVVEVKSLENNTRARITAKLNEDSQRADNIWNMIKNKVLVGASIEYEALKKHYTVIKNKLVRVLDDLRLTGFTLTSKMMQGSALINNTFVKSIADVELKEANKMVGEDVKQEEKKMEKVEEGATKEEIKSLTEQVKSLTELVEKQKCELEEVKSMSKDLKIAEEVKAKLKEEIRGELKPEIKALVEPNQEKFELVKSGIEEVKSLVKEGKIDEAWKKAAEKTDELYSQGLLNAPLLA